MLTPLKCLYLISILAVTFLGGYLPLFKPERARDVKGFPGGQAFAAGVFLALSLTMMLPSAYHLFGTALPGVDFPLGSVIAIASFVLLLWLDHMSMHIRPAERADESLAPPSIPIIMTFMIAVPSFFLGAALGVSESLAALFIFVAIMAHKGTAGFALALKMARSKLTRPRVFALYLTFALSTPTGIIVGGEIHQFLTGNAMLLIKGVILSLAAGTFLYMSTLHELKHTPMIEQCNCRKGFLLMLSGFAVTALVRLLLGEVHRL
jgi:zinc transporter ZupT